MRVVEDLVEVLAPLERTRIVVDLAVGEEQLYATPVGHVGRSY